MMDNSCQLHSMLSVKVCIRDSVLVCCFVLLRKRMDVCIIMEIFLGMGSKVNAKMCKCVERRAQGGTRGRGGVPKCRACFKVGMRAV